MAQVLGSAIGRALAPNNQLLQVAAGTLAGTVASAIGHNFGQVLSASLSGNASQIPLDGLFNGFGLNLASAAAGSVASLITAEVGTALGLHGYGAQLFDAGVGGVASQVATQLVQKGGLSALNAINWTEALGGGAASLGGAVGSIIGNQIVHAETQAGAIGGQLLGAIGSAIGASYAIGQSLGLVLDFVIPGIGSLIGTVLGTLLGDAFGPGTPHPASTHILDWSGAHYTDRLYTAVEGGKTDTSQAMADAAAGVVNSYLDAVKGAALDHVRQVMIGYQTVDPSHPYFSGWLPGAPKYATASEAVFAAALDVLHNTEVIGGDLLLKRAHTNSAYSDTSVLAGDLQVAQDYENYLNNREAINALMAANPDSAFTAGWIATFARVNDLGLNHAGANDFLGGLVGWLDSVKKAGLVFDAAGVSYNQTGSTALIDIKVPNGIAVPGALSAFADQFTETSDSSGTTLHFAINSGLVPLGFRGPSSTALVSGTWQASNASGNTIWFGSGSAPNEYHDNSAGQSHDILIGGGYGDSIYAGDGWNFVDAGGGNDGILSGSGNDILHGGRGDDYLRGGGGDDTYTFNRGDGADFVLDDVTVTATTTTWNDWTETPYEGGIIFHHDPVTTTTTTHADAGRDTLAFGPGITPADVSVRRNGADLIIAVKDPAHPGVAFAQLADNITLSNWTDPLDRIETLAFADGTVLNISDGASLAALRVPFGAALSGNTVFENAPNGTVIGTVTGYDLDTDVRLHYALTDNAGGRFAINGVTGAISVANGFLLDYEAAHAWQVTVRTLDDASYSIDKTFTIAVADVPEAPVGAVLSGGSVAENAANGTAVGTVTGVDPDPHAVLSWSLLDNAGGRFAINASSGAITVANGAALDYEAATSHQITVRVADQSGHVFDRAFTIAVTDVLEGPVGAVLSGGSVAENSATGTPVGTMSGVDHDAHAVLTWSLLDNAGGRFAIDGASGAITVANGAALDYEAATSHQIAVRVADQAGHVFDRAFSIAVTDVLEGPVGAVLSGDSVAENSATGTPVGTMSGVDHDAHAVLTWSLLDNAGGRFAIDGLSGAITVANGAALDYEAATSHQIAVRVADQAGHVFDRAFSIAVTDVLEGPVGAVLSGDSVAENSATGTAVGTVTGVDHDAHAVLTWSLLDDAGGRFAIDGASGAITVANGAALDYEAATSHQIAVHVADQAGNFLNRAFGIAVGDVNEAPTDAILSDNHVAENAANGTPVGTVTGIDPDAATVFHYSLTDDAGGRFAIDGASGAITVADGLLLDYEAATSHQITVRVADEAGNVLDRPFGIAVTDVLEGPVDMALSGHTVEENSAYGTRVGTATATDPDAHAVLTWSLLDTAGGRFAINASSGEITVASAMLDYENAQTHKITVRAADQDDHVLDRDFIIAVTDVMETPGPALHDVVTIASGDFNGDGKDDILWRNDNGAVATWDMNDRSFGGAVIANVSSDWHIAGTGDFNGDGKTDILWRNDNGSVATWDMNDRSFGGAVIDTTTTNDWHIAGTGDFNGDGKTDILWRNDNDPVATWDMNDRSFGSAVIDTATTNDWHIAGTGDFNGDGKDDILWRNDNGAVATWDMNDRSFGGTVIANVSTDWYVAGTGDFNGDHKADILWRNDNGAVATWDMDDHNFGSAVIANVSNDWHIASTGDYNGDGKTDILWRNDNGSVATWDMYDHSFGGAVIAGVPNDWHIA